MTVGVAIVAPTRDGLAACLRAVAAQVHQPERVVVAVGSNLEDHARELAGCLAAETPIAPVTILVAQPDDSAPAVANLGVEELLRSGCQAVALVAQDARLEPDWTQRLVSGARSGVAAVSGRLMAPNRRTVRYDGGWIERPRMTIRYAGHQVCGGAGLGVSLSRLEVLHPAALLLTAHSLRSAGAFDTAFHSMEYAVAEWCGRVSARGERLLHLSEAAVIQPQWSPERSRFNATAERDRLLLAARTLQERDSLNQLAEAEWRYLTACVSEAEQRAVMYAYLRFVIELPDLLLGHHLKQSPDTATAIAETLMDLREKHITAA